MIYRSQYFTNFHQTEYHVRVPQVVVAYCLSQKFQILVSTKLEVKLIHSIYPIKKKSYCQTCHKRTNIRHLNDRIKYDIYRNRRTVIVLNSNKFLQYSRNSIGSAQPNTTEWLNHTSTSAALSSLRPKQQFSSI